MKLDAKVKWLIDEPTYGINVDKIETIVVDSDYVRSSEDEVLECVENELVEKYGTSFYAKQDDFVVTNMHDILVDLAFEEYESKKSEY